MSRIPKDLSPTALSALTELAYSAASKGKSSLLLLRDNGLPRGTARYSEKRGSLRGLETELKLPACAPPGSASVVDVRLDAVQKWLA